jgi:hypothetical protein
VSGAFVMGNVLVDGQVTVHSMQSEQEQERAIQAAGAPAPRLRPADIDAAIASEHYFTAADGVYGAAARGPKYGESGSTFSWQEPPALSLLTICVLVLRNGFTVTGESACASPENFNAEIGRQVAREKARDKIWALEGYLLKERLHAAT